MTLLVLLSPAKKQMMATPNVNYRPTQPRLRQQTAVLVDHLKTLNANQLATQLNISNKLSQINHQRYQTFDTQHNTKQNASPALWSFQGDVYRQLNAETLDKSAIDFAQHHVRLLSGLYGLLRPLDLIQLYRLDMGSKLKNQQFSNLYQFWDNRITDLLNRDSEEKTTIINLASSEYSKAVDSQCLKAPMIEIGFRQQREGEVKNIGLMAKRARGQMARFIIDHQLKKAEDIKKFKCDGYKFSSALSQQHHWIFVTNQK